MRPGREGRCSCGPRGRRAAALLVEVVVARPRLGRPARACRGLRLLREPAAIGELFLTDYLLAFEITSIVLLVAAVGGVVLGTAQERER